MDITRLKYFYFVAKEGGFTKAAKALRIAQPAISKFVKDLEQELGYPLFHRLGREIRLTKGGGDVLRHCEVIFGQISKIESLKKPSSTDISGPVSIAASDSVATFLVAPVVRSLCSKYPKVIPTIVSGAASDLCFKIKRGELEFGIFFHLPELDSELEVRRTMAIEHKLVVAKKFRNDKTVLQNLIGSREIDDSSTSSFPILKRLQQNHTDAGIRISTNSISIHKELVISGFGVSVLPNFAIQSELATGKLVSVLRRNEKLSWMMKMVCRKDQKLSETAQLFVEKIFNFSDGPIAKQSSKFAH
jgi:DNA-binding transcriptional LysR family regulator